jgi:hypothetical protein
MPASPPKVSHPGLDTKDERWQLVEQIASSTIFSKAPRLSSFLRYISIAGLSGHLADLNERQIGIDVFERNPAYNPGEDSIVRTSARLLRNKLEEYFATEGISSTWILSIPKGSYVPLFERRALALSGPQPAEPEAEREASSYLKRYSNAAVLLGLAVAAVIALSLWHIYGRQTLAPNVSVASGDVLWSSLFTAERRTILVPSDNTLANRLSLSDYLQQSRAIGHQAHRSTGLADLNLAFRLARLPESQGKDFDIRYARVLTLADVKNSNLILVGGVIVNPWVNLYHERLDFSVDEDRTGLTFARIRNPTGNEKPVYQGNSVGDETVSFGLIAYLSNLDGSGNVLLVEGSSSAGTETACDFLLNPTLLLGIEKGLLRPNHKLKHFEALLETRVLQGNAVKTTILASRPLP